MDGSFSFATVAAAATMLSCWDLRNLPVWRVFRFTTYCKDWRNSVAATHSYTVYKLSGIILRIVMALFGIILTALRDTAVGSCENWYVSVVSLLPLLSQQNSAWVL